MATWRVLGRAVVTNALSPHPYLFWAVVGAPLIVRGANATGPAGAVAFLVGFYALLVGVKLMLAQIAGHTRGWLRGPAYRGVLIVSGLLLGVLRALAGRRRRCATLESGRVRAETCRRLLYKEVS
jgi:threonine/homoserine/homoserine lactone efflux protein